MKRLLILKALTFILIVPGTVAVALPLALVHYSADSMRLDLGPYRYIGLVGFVMGAAGYLWCLTNLTRMGQGIPAPVEHTQFLVRQGPYRFVRNPMYLAGALFFFGVAIACEQGILIIYATAVTLCYHLGVVFLEEPALRERFGESYEQYCTQVPRWLPGRGIQRLTEPVE